MKENMQYLSLWNWLISLDMMPSILSIFQQEDNFILLDDRVKLCVCVCVCVCVCITLSLSIHSLMGTYAHSIIWLL
jgi:hypothetical protein